MDNPNELAYYSFILTKSNNMVYVIHYVVLSLDC